MKELSLNQMEMVRGGGFLGCVGVVAAGIGIAALVISTPATGGLSIAATAWLMTQGAAAGWGFGASAYDCAMN
jgi:hypothetical protein